MKRLLEDSGLPAELRGDLARARSAGHDYPATAKLLQLRAALSERVPARPSTHGRAWSTRALQTGWKLGALLVLGTGAAFLAQPATQAPTFVAPPPPPPAADTMLPTAAPVQPEPPVAEPAVLMAPASPVAPEASSSRREIAQLVRMRALLERDPAAAHRLARRAEREFPHGLLTEERRALAILSLAKMGAKQVAEQNAQRYFARYPHSPMREQIEAALRH